MLSLQNCLSTTWRIRISVTACGPNLSHPLGEIIVVGGIVVDDVCEKEVFMGELVVVGWMFVDDICEKEVPLFMDELFVNETMLKEMILKEMILKEMISRKLILKVIDLDQMILKAASHSRNGKESSTSSSCLMF